MDRTLVDRETLREMTAVLGAELKPRKYSHAISALGLQEAESRALPAVERGRGRTKHYYRESAWALAALARKYPKEMERRDNELERFRLLWDELWHAGLGPKMSFIPEGREYGALLLFAFGLEFGPDPRSLVAFFSESPERWNISSFGPRFLKDVVDAYLGASGSMIRDAFDHAGLSERQVAVEFAGEFVTRLGDALKLEAEIEASEEYSSKGGGAPSM